MNLYMCISTRKTPMGPEVHQAVVRAPAEIVARTLLALDDEGEVGAVERYVSAIERLGLVEASSRAVDQTTVLSDWWRAEVVPLGVAAAGAAPGIVLRA